MDALLVGGMANGAVYGLVAVGIVLVFRATGLVNFAQGEVLMLGSYAFLFLSTVHLGAPGELVAVVATGFAVGLLFFAVTHYLLGKAEELHVLIGTLALSIILLNAARLAFTDIPQRVSGWLFGDETVTIGTGVIAVNALVILAVGLVVTLSINLWFRYTLSGRAVRAVAENREFAALSGIPVGRMLAISWGLGGMVAAIGGLLLGPVAGVYPSLGQDVIFKGFVAATLGGFESEVGAMLGGLFLGVVEIVGVVLVGGDAKELVSFTVLIALLLLRPTGLFGRATFRRV